MKILFSKSTILIVCLALACRANGQTHVIEKLKQAIDLATNPGDSMLAIFTFCDQWRNLPIATVSKWATTGEKLATRLNNESAQWQAKYYIQTSLVKEGAYDMVLGNCTSALNWLNEQKGKFWFLDADYRQLKANVLIRTNRYREAISELYELLTKSEKERDSLTQIKTFSMLGWVHMEMQQYEQAMGFFQKSLHVSNNKQLYLQYGVLYSNIASTYNNLGKFDSASAYVNDAIDIARTTQSLNNLCNALNIQADIFLNNKKIDEAKRALDEALAIRRQIGDPFYTISDLAQLAIFYSQNGLQSRGIALSKEALQLCRQYAITSKLLFVYAAFAENYKAAGDFKAYSKTLEKIIDLKDSLYQVNSAEALADLQAKYNVQKKENIIINQQVQLATRDYWIAATVAGVSIALLLLFLGFKNLRRRQQETLQSVIRQETEKSLKAVFQAEEIQRQRIAAELHDNIGSQISYISSNINWIVDPPVPLTIAEQTERLENINETSQSLMRNMRETIWALNGKQILLDEFADKLKAHIQSSTRFLPKLHFHSTETLDDTPIKLSSILALNLLRIFQEAVTNTVKYAEASTLILEITSKGNQYSIELVDDGKGFNSTSPIHGEHYGLRNMRFRAQESVVNLTIQSSPGKGTSILVNAYNLSS